MGEGAVKAWRGLFVSVETRFTDHVSALSLSGRLANERIPLNQVLGCKAVSGQRGVIWP